MPGSDQRSKKIPLSGRHHWNFHWNMELISKEELPKNFGACDASQALLFDLSQAFFALK